VTLHNNGYERQQNYDSFFSSGSGSGTFFSSAASSNVSPGTSSGTSSSSCAAAPASAPGTCFWKCSASLLRLSRLSGPEEEEAKVRQAITIVGMRQTIRVQSTKQCEKCHTQLVDN